MILSMISNIAIKRKYEKLAKMHSRCVYLQCLRKNKRIN